MSEFLVRLLETLRIIVVAVVATVGIWIVANLIVNQVRGHWRRFLTLAMAFSGFVVGALLSGNRATRYSAPGSNAWATFGYWVWFPLVCAAIAALVGALLAAEGSSTQSALADPTASGSEQSNARTVRRMVIGVVGLGALGVFTAAMLRAGYRPEMNLLWLAICTLAAAAAGAGISSASHRPAVNGGITGAAIGWVIGAWGVPAIGNGQIWWSYVAMTVPFALVGLRLALDGNPDGSQRARLDQSLRAVVFVAPAVIFITAALVVPAIITAVFSLKDSESTEWVKLQNYVDIFTDKNVLDLSHFSAVFTSRLFYIGIVALVLFVLLAIRGHHDTGKLVELGSPSMGPMVVGGFFVLVAFFSTSRGAIINNLWWVVVVTLFATSIGLAIAVLADGVAFEKVAKSIIFMPMAISLVGASVIWRFMYVARDASKEQTGVMNALWVGLGKVSTGQKIAPTLIVGVGVIIVLFATINQITKRAYPKALAYLVGGTVALVAVTVVWRQLGGPVQRIVLGAIITALWVAAIASVVRSVRQKNYEASIVPALTVLLLGWFLLRYWSIVGGNGVGGTRINSGGRRVTEAIDFVQSQPFNNMWLMVVLIWIQAGFAMVILSAAIKAVPSELIEAARVDGANSSQVFWRVTLPQIGPTIGVVVTTLIVLVMKVYDVVKVMTNGNFKSEVLANSMFNESFKNQDAGLGSALAMLILLSVLPVMILNIRRTNREA